MNKAQEITSVAALLCSWGIGLAAARAAAVTVVSNGAVDIDPIFFNPEEDTSTAINEVSKPPFFVGEDGPALLSCTSLADPLKQETQEEILKELKLLNAVMKKYIPSTEGVMDGCCSKS